MAEVCSRGSWICQADFSIGVEDSCKWEIPKNIGRKLLNEWEKLKTTFKPPTEKSVFLGYNGIRVFGSGDLEFYSYGKTVTLKKDNIIETKQDKNRKFEKMIFSTAPKGMVPQAFYMFELE
jgi:hypothetical protein